MSLSPAIEDPSSDYLSAGLHPDAEWKKIQQNTFTRWVNKHLRCANVSVDNLETDFEEGLKLIRLVEVLSGKSLGRFNKRVTFRSQKLENISLALNFLENEEHIKIVSIDSSAIVDKNLKLILGLVWTLILHYSISKAEWDLPYDPNQERLAEQQPERTPKQKLMMWIKAKLPPGLPLNNFTSDWNDGVLLGALVDSCAPELHIGWRDWIPSEALQSTKTAMHLADEYLDVAPLITPEELIDPTVDEKSVMTYLAQFPQARYKPAPGRIVDLDANPIINATSSFTIHTLNAVLEPRVTIKGPSETPVHTELRKQTSTIYEVIYKPHTKGEHEVLVSIRDSNSGEISNLNVQRVNAIESAQLDYESNARVGKKSNFHITNAAEGIIELVIVDPKGNEMALPLTREGSDYLSDFTPVIPGVHSVNVFQKKRHISGSPFPLNVTAPSKFRVWGRGIASEGVRVGDEVILFVDLDPEASDRVSINLRDPTGRLLPVDERFDQTKRRQVFIYKPQSPGTHELELKSDNKHIAKSPYKVQVGPVTNSLIRAFGPGLEGGVAKLPGIFYVDTNGETDGLGFSIEGPSKTEITCTDVGRGCAVVQYMPVEPGVYEVNVLSNSEHIKDSPFVVMIDAPNERLKPSAVRVSGVDSSTVFSKGDKAIFTIDTSDAGVGAFPKVKLLDCNYAEIPVSMIEREKGVYECSFRPSSIGRYYVNVSAGGVAVPGSPFMVKVREAVDLSRVRVYGPGVGSEVRSEQPTHFVIDAKGAGSGEIDVSLTDRDGSAVDLDVLDNNDGSFTVKYTPPKPGTYKLRVVFAGVEIPKVEINVKPYVDISGIRVEGLENAIITMNSEKEFRIVTFDGKNTRVLIRDPAGHIIEALIESTQNGLRVRFIPIETGDYTIEVTYQHQQIHRSPFTLHSEAPSPVSQSQLKSSPKSDQKTPNGIIAATNGTEKDVPEKNGSVERGSAPADLVVVSGPGLGTVRAARCTHVMIDAKHAGFGNIDLYVDGPTKTEINCYDNHDGTCSVFFEPTVPGRYYLRVLFDDCHVPGSPFEIIAQPPVRERLRRSNTIALASRHHHRHRTPHSFQNVLIGHRKEIRINTGSAVQHSTGLEAITEDPDGRKYLLNLTPESDGVFVGGWTAQKLGETKFSIFFDGVLVKEAKTIVSEGQDASKCRAVGEGLERAIVGERTKFRIDTQGAGEGALAMSIKGPSESKTNVTDHSNGSCTVEYVLLTPGLYEINIVYGEKKEPIPGSPFTTVADYRRDSSKIQIEGFHESVRIGQPSSFIIDATKTAALPVDARLPVGQQQPIIEEVEPRRYRCTFTTSGKAGDVVPLEVFYGGEPISSRPFNVTLTPAFDASLVKLKDQSGGEFPSESRASLPATFVIDVSEAGKPDKLSAKVTGPDGKLRKSTIIATGQANIYELSFTPDLAGVYEVLIFINDKPISRTAYRIYCVPVGDASKCLMKEMATTEQKWAAGEPKRFAIDVSGAGPGALSVVPMRERDIECSVEKGDAPGTYYVILKPLATGPHLVYILYGGREIPNGIISFECLSPSELRELEQVQVLRRSDDNFEIPFESSVKSPAPLETISPQNVVTSPVSPKQEVEPELLIPRDFNFSFDPGLDFNKLSATVTMPSGKHDVAQIQDNHDGTVTVSYKPVQCGHHSLSIQHNGVNMVGSPIAFFVDVAGAGPVTVYGPGLSHAVVGEPAAFTVSAKGSQAKELSVSVEGCAKATIKCDDNKDGTCSVAWVPPVPGEYKINVKLAGKPVKDSPFTVLVAGEGQKRAHLSVGSTSEVSLNISAKELKGLSASIKSPLGIEEPCFIRSIDDTHIGVSFTPREEGEHLITVKRDGRVLPKSPFRVKVDKSQVGDASKVVVSGKGIATAVCQEFNDVVVDTRNAGFGGLSVSVEGPSKAELSCKEAKDGLIHISYRPTEPGIYILSIKFADLHVTDSPFTVNCTGKGVGAVKETISKDASQAPMVLPGQDANLYLHFPKTSPMEMTAKVMMPNGHSEDVEMRDVGDGFYQIRFRTEQEGIYAVSVFHRDQHVSGSPFQFTVGHFGEGGAHKVRAGGTGLAKGETQNAQSFNIYTREAGKGKLAVAIEGPSKAELKFDDHKDGNCHVEYKVTEPGEYLISVKFNDEHIPDSPFKAFIAPATGEVRRLELAAFPDSGMPGKACTFTVLTHRARGHLEAKVRTPNNTIETIDIVPIDEGESYALRFIPNETGTYYVDVTLDGAPMRDSPFRLRIGQKEESDPTAISVSGDGLRRGQTGQKCEFIVNTCNAGSGLLQIQIDGPSKVTLDAYELEQGYKVRYMALAPGVYYAAVKYSGVHIPGSPFKINMEGKELGGSEPDSSLIKIDALAKTSKGTVAQVPEYKGDASKVTVKGAGLNKFFPGRPATFNIDTGMAGTNLLFVGVVTTKGPCEEVIVRHTGQGSYTVTYRIQDRVKGFVFVKYGDTNIPGSPFAISF